MQPSAAVPSAASVPRGGGMAGRGSFGGPAVGRGGAAAAAPAGAARGAVAPCAYPYLSYDSYIFIIIIIF